MKKFGTVMVVLFTCLLLLCTVFAQTNQHSDIERSIIAAANQCIDGEGACELNFAEIFTGFEWDTVSIFVGGNSKQIKENLGIDHDISDGIVFFTQWKAHPGSHVNLSISPGRSAGRWILHGTSKRGCTLLYQPVSRKCHGACKEIRLS